MMSSNFERQKPSYNHSRNGGDGASDASESDVFPNESNAYLISYSHSSRARRKKQIKCVSVVLSILTVISIAVLCCYVALSSCWWFTNCRALKILSMNVWGIPEAFGSQYKQPRIKAIAEEIGKGEYDIYLLQELWMQADHYTIQQHLPPDYKMTGFRELSLADCDGRVSPLFCSGLAIITKDLEVVESEFNSYSYHGDPMRSWIDGEYLAKKGVGRLRIHMPLDTKPYIDWDDNPENMTTSRNVTIDLFTTHTAADAPYGYNYSNVYYRDKQVEELVTKYLNVSTADLVLFGADINAEPKNKPGEPYHMIKDIMTNCIEEFYYKLMEWLTPDKATYGNKRNTFSYMYNPQMIDYIFYKTNRPDSLKVFTSVFDLPFFKFDYKASTSEKSKNGTQNDTDKILSLSDHDAVTSTIYIWQVL